MQHEDGPEILCRSKVLITATGGARGKKPIELKKIADAALDISKKNGFQVCPSPFSGPMKEFMWVNTEFYHWVVSSQEWLCCCLSFNYLSRLPHGLVQSKVLTLQWFA